MRLLVIEDDRALLTALGDGLAASGFAVDRAPSAECAFDLLRVNPYDLVVLDVGLPGVDGLTLLRALRRSESAVPVLVLTARGEVADRVAGLDAGADDYVVKPFAFPELVARVHALSRRRAPAVSLVLRVGDLELDRRRFQVRRGGVPVSLTAKEFAILEYFMRHAGELVTRTMLLESCWDETYDGLSNLVDVHVSRVRRKIDVAGAAALLHTIRGAGFVRMWAADGRVLAASGTIPPALARQAAPAVPATRYATIGVGRAAYRIIWYAAPGIGWSEIGIRVGRELRTLRRVQLAIGASAGLLLGTLACLAWAITTRATAEIDQLAAQLETLEAASLDRRLAPGRTSEVDRLVAVLNRLLSRLETAVEHLRRFTADAAHELRTPIAALRAHLEVALARGGSPDGYRNGLLDALEQAERLGRVAADLLTLSAVEAGAGGTDVVHLDAVAREVADFLEPVAQEQGRRFACESERPVAVCGAPDLLKRLVLNLVDNAFRHTPPSAAVRLAVRSDDGTATIEVDDDGPGIPATDLPQVSERFRRGRRATSGTGLGLALCQEIATRHLGRIALESDPGLGTKVIVTLPLADARAGF